MRREEAHGRRKNNAEVLRAGRKGPVLGVALLYQNERGRGKELNSEKRGETKWDRTKKRRSREKNAFGSHRTLISTAREERRRRKEKEKKNAEGE